MNWDINTMTLALLTTEELIADKVTGANLSDSKECGDIIPS